MGLTLLKFQVVLAYTLKLYMYYYIYNYIICHVYKFVYKQLITGLIKLKVSTVIKNPLNYGH